MRPCTGLEALAKEVAGAGGQRQLPAEFALELSPAVTSLKGCTNGKGGLADEPPTGAKAPTLLSYSHSAWEALADKTLVLGSRVSKTFQP